MKIEIVLVKTLIVLELSVLVSIYQSMYSTKPWGLWKKCSNKECSKSWSIEEKSFLETLNFYHCNLPVCDHWSIDWLIG